jgi:hypothetical protein
MHKIHTTDFPAEMPILDIGKLKKWNGSNLKFLKSETLVDEKCGTKRKTSRGSDGRPAAAEELEE